MKKRYEAGFMLAETLVVTIFVAGVLIFLFIQFSKLSNSYNEYYKYNASDKLYALAGVKRYLEHDSIAISALTSNHFEYLDISDCSIFTEAEYCIELLDYEGIDEIIVTPNPVNVDLIDISDQEMIKFINKIKHDGTEEYRIIAKFNDGSFATLRLSVI